MLKHGEVPRASSQPSHFPQPLRKYENGKGPPYAPLIFFSCVFSVKQKGGGEIDRIAFLTGRAKTIIEERLIKEEERQNKAQRRWDSSLSILFPLSLPSLFLFEIRTTKRMNCENRRRVRLVLLNRLVLEETGRFNSTKLSETFSKNIW